MKAVILAAGMGTRIADTIPKPLIPLKNEETIFDFQIENLTKYISLNDILVVVGYKKELLMEKYPDLMYVYNHKYAQTNTGKSLLLALKKFDDDVLWLNGDVFFDERIIDLLLKSMSSSILVQAKECGAEEVKYTVDDNGYIDKISKEVKNSLGEALGINLIKRKDLETFIIHLEKITPKDYFEKAIENMIKMDVAKFSPVDTGELYCTEIDFPEDLELVKKYIMDHNV